MSQKRTLKNLTNYNFKLSDQKLLQKLLYTLGENDRAEMMSKAALHEFGSIQATLKQSSENLKRIQGFTPVVIRHLKTVYSLLREIIRPEGYPLKPRRQFKDLSYFLLTAPKFDGESLRLLFFDENQGILRDTIFKKGSGNQVKFYFREIVREILAAGVSRCVLIHHKIGSYPGPNSIDLERYKNLNNGLAALDLKLVDFLIIAENTIFSLVDMKLYPSLPHSFSSKKKRLNHKHK